MTIAGGSTPSRSQIPFVAFLLLLWVPLLTWFLQACALLDLTSMFVCFFKAKMCTVYLCGPSCISLCTCFVFVLLFYFLVIGNVVTYAPCFYLENHEAYWRSWNFSISLTFTSWASYLIPSNAFLRDLSWPLPGLERTMVRWLTFMCRHMQRHTRTYNSKLSLLLNTSFHNHLVRHCGVKKRKFEYGHHCSHHGSCCSSGENRTYKIGPLLFGFKSSETLLCVLLLLCCSNNRSKGLLIYFFFVLWRQ